MLQPQSYAIVVIIINWLIGDLENVMLAVCCAAIIWTECVSSDWYVTRI